MRGEGNSLKFLIITLITVTVTGVFAQGKTGFISGTFNLVPLGISSLTASAKSTPDSAENDELTRLKKENEELRAELIDYLDLQRENERLLKYFNISKQKPDLTLKPAEVIARDAEDDFYSFTIGAGTADGVSEGNPVITENGLIGQVSRAEQYSAVVTTILSPKLKIGAYDSRTADRGVVSGTAELSLKTRTALTMLTEDNSINAEVIMKILETRGVHSELARDGQEVVDMFLKRGPYHYQAILMDMMMPLMDGQSAARAIRESGAADAREIPILALTADTYGDIEQRCMSAGMDGYLRKPIDTDELFRVLVREFDKE